MLDGNSVKKCIKGLHFFPLSLSSLHLTLECRLGFVNHIWVLRNCSPVANLAKLSALCMTLEIGK